MYGLVFEIVEEFVIEKQGLPVWHTIKQKAKCEVKDQAFLRRSYYPDEELVDIIVAASEVLGVAVPAILETFGHYVIRHHYLNGYNDLLRAQGSTLRKWLSNLNAMHDHIQKSFPGKEFQAPIFWCEDCSTVEGSILLHYYSLRGVLLVPMVVGIIEELSSFQFECDVKMTQLALQGENQAEFTTWRITALDPDQRYKLSPTIATDESLKVDFSAMKVPSKCPFTGTDLSEGSAQKCPYSSGPNSSEGTVCPISTHQSNTSCKSLGLSLSKMKEVFPFHLLVDEKFTILQVGNGLPGLMKKPLDFFVGKHIGDVLQITRPVLGSKWDWDALKKLADQHFFLAPTSNAKTSSLKRTVSMVDSSIKFKSSMIDIANGEVMFALSPDARDVVELRNMGLTLTDLPLHGCQRDSVFLGEYIVQEVDKAHKLDKLSKKLENEKNLSNTLLYNMLPKSIADELRSGKTSEPKHHENVSLFFSDVVGFTSICDQVDPWSVIDMLNQLYSIMDFLSERFHLYKVETVGDAYVAASGLPYDDPHHAENIANFAVAVKECVKLVKSPVDGESIALRIGIHTGPCTAGVVGTLTPHYCLFGDTVNVTARHEQTGQAGKIQCSSDLFGRLKHFSMHSEEQFNLVPRGLVSMKGKKDCYCYWLESGTDNNEFASPAAIEKMREEVSQMLNSEKWKMRRYFRRSGGLRGDRDDQSVSSGSTFRTTDLSESHGSNHLSISGGSTDESTGESDGAPLFEEEQDPASESSEVSCCDISGRDLADLDDMLDDNMGSSSRNPENGLLKLVWEKSLTREDFVANIHLLMSPLLKLCLFDESSHQFPDTMDLLDGQLFGFIDRISKTFKAHTPFHSLRHSAHVVAWASYLFERIQDSGAGHTGSVDNSPWFRFALVMAALVRDCKHSGVSDDQLQAERHIVHELYDGGSCQAKHSLAFGIGILEEEFPDLYDEITWRFPRFLHLMRKTALAMDPTESFQKAMASGAQSPREIMARTEASMQVVLRVASLGHFALGETSFLEWNEAALTEKRFANLAKRGSDPLPYWHDECIKFMKGEFLPLVDQCEAVLPKTVSLRETVTLNLKNFEAQGQMKLCPIQPTCGTPSARNVAVDVFF